MARWGMLLPLLLAVILAVPSEGTHDGVQEALATPKGAERSARALK